MYLEVKKNRFDGQLGKIDINFVPSNQMYTEIESMYQKKSTAIDEKPKSKSYRLK